MSGVGGRMVAVLLGLAFALAGCGRTYEWHQKVTVTVETPNGVKRGASVTRVTWRDYSEFERAIALTGSGGSIRENGEAAHVAVAPDKHLFLLLTQSPINLCFAALRAQTNRPADREVNRWGGVGMALYTPTLRAERRVMPLPREKYPELVTFTDPLVPTSARAVDPDRLDAVFGPGYRLSSITVEITDEPVTRRIATILPWLGDPNGLKDLRWSSLPSFVTSSISRLYAGPIERPKP